MPATSWGANRNVSNERGCKTPSRRSASRGPPDRLVGRRDRRPMGRDSGLRSSSWVIVKVTEQGEFRCTSRAIRVLEDLLLFAMCQVDEHGGRPAGACPPPAGRVSLSRVFGVS